MRHTAKLTLGVLFVLFFSGFMLKLHKDQGSHHLMERDISENQKEFIKELFKYADDDDIPNPYEQEKSYGKVVNESNAVNEGVEPMINEGVNKNFPPSIDGLPFDKATKIKLTEEYKKQEREKRLKF